MSLKDRLKKCREDRGISQTALANALGLSIGGIGGYENGSRFPKAEILAKIAEYFNVPVADLADGPELSLTQYLAFTARLTDALDNTSSDDFEALGLSEREIRTAIRQNTPIREDRAVYLSEALGTKIDDILAMKPTPQEERLSAYWLAFQKAAVDADPDDVEDAINFLDYRKNHKKS